MCQATHSLRVPTILSLLASGRPRGALFKQTRLFWKEVKFMKKLSALALVTFTAAEVFAPDNISQLIGVDIQSEVISPEVKIPHYNLPATLLNLNLCQINLS